VAFRKYLRIVLIVVLAILAWRHFASVSTTRLIVVALGLLALIAVIYQMTSLLRKSRKLRDEVPKNPLGLDS
jgi:small-conductance mechanosensitive channel